MGKSQKKRLLEAHVRTMKNWLLIPYYVTGGMMLHVKSR